MKASRLIAILLLSGTATTVYASQGSITLPTTGTLPGLTLVQDVNAANAAMSSAFSGNTPPGAPVQFQLWANTSISPAALNIYDGTNWVSLGYVDSTNHFWNVQATNGVFNDGLTAYGYASIGGGYSTQVGLLVSNTNLTGATQNGIYAAPGFSAAATNGFGIVAAPGTAASAHLTSVYDVYASVPVLGAGATIGSVYGFYAPDLNSGSANWPSHLIG